MVELYKKQLRNSRKWSDLIILGFIATFALTVIGQELGSVVLTAIPFGKLFDLITGDSDVSSFALDYFSFIGIWMVGLAAIFAFKGNRKMLSALKKNDCGNTGKGLLIGALLGFGSNSVCVLLSLLMGDIKLSYSGFRLGTVLLFVFVVFVQSGAEELMTRHYFYQKLRRRYKNPLVAVIVNGLLFSLLHFTNPGFGIVPASQIFIIAVVFSMLVYYYDGLWIAMSFHAAWNFTQNIIYGLPNSGIVTAYSIFKLEAASARNGLFYNVNFGVEGSIGASIILAAVGVAIYMISRDRPEYNDVWKELDVPQPQDESAA